MMPVVDGTLYRVLGRREQDHDDLVQASFEQIVLTLTRGKFAGECSLTTWASAITCKVALHAIRRRCVERRIFDESLDAERWSRQAAGLSDPESQTVSREELARLRFHLSRMSQKLANTLLIHDMLGCGLLETAAITGVSQAAAQSRLVRGRKELCTRLGRPGPPGPLESPPMEALQAKAGNSATHSIGV
ncbi:MAG TPA: RNA polymerase sigma factor [Polyangiaceae bacterium]|nr:RNA polymerase sigma factor [Polyangiaceae bacterium]